MASVYGVCGCERHKGYRRKQHLEAHHCAPKAQYPKFRDDKNNIIYVCADCHRYIIHDDGNLSKLSDYGEELCDAFLNGRGYGGQPKGNPDRAYVPKYKTGDWVDRVVGSDDDFPKIDLMHIMPVPEPTRAGTRERTSELVFALFLLIVGLYLYFTGYFS